MRRTRTRTTPRSNTRPSQSVPEIMQLTNPNNFQQMCSRKKPPQGPTQHLRHRDLPTVSAKAFLEVKQFRLLLLKITGGSSSGTPRGRSRGTTSTPGEMIYSSFKYQLLLYYHCRKTNQHYFSWCSCWCVDQSGINSFSLTSPLFSLPLFLHSLFLSLSHTLQFKTHQ